MFKSARREAVEQTLKTVINLHHFGKTPEFIAKALDYNLEFVMAAVIVNYDQPTYLRRLLEKIQRKSEYRCRMTGNLLHKPVLAADGELYEKKVYESLTDISQLSIKPMFMPDLQARINQYCKQTLKTTLVLCIDKGFYPDLTLRLTGECLRVLDLEEDSEYFLMVTAKLKNINHMLYLYSTLRDLRPSLLKGLLVELSEDRAQYQQTVQLLRCIRCSDIETSGRSLCEYFNRAMQRKEIDCLAFECYVLIILHKLEFKGDDCYRVFNRLGYSLESTTNLATIYNNLGNLFESKGDLVQAEVFLMKCLEVNNTVLPRNHSDLATIFHDLAIMFDSKGDLEQAEQFYVKSLEIMEVVLPSDNPYLASIYNSLGVFIGIKGRA
jgi:tetratricopeptide (TPR) repeat protein